MVSRAQAPLDQMRVEFVFKYDVDLNSHFSRLDRRRRAGLIKVSHSLESASPS